MENFKQVIAIIIIIIVIIIADIILEKNTNSTIEIVSEKLELVDEKVEKFESDNVSKLELKKEVNKMVDIWKEKQKILTYYIEHDEIEKISDKIELIRKQIEIEEFGDARQAIEETKFLLDHLKEKEKLNLRNIL